MSLPTFRTNKLGKILVAVGIGLICIVVLMAAQERPPARASALLLAGIAGAATVVFGLYIRSIGAGVAYVATAVALLSIVGFAGVILHSMLYHWAGWNFLGFGAAKSAVGDAQLNTGGFCLLTGTLAFMLLIMSHYLQRTEGEETADAERAAAQAAEMRERRPQSSMRPSAPEVESFSGVSSGGDSAPRCPNCNSIAEGNLLSGNRLIDCGACHSTFCGECASGMISKACPRCGNDDQDRITFRDTGRSWM